MTVKHSQLIRKRTTLLSRVLMLAFFAFSLTAAPAFAQEYKEAYNAGLEAYKAGNAKKAYEQWVSAAKGAEAAGDKDVAQKAKYYVAQLDYKNGLESFKGENYEAALKSFDAGAQRYPTYAKNFYGRGLALMKMQRVEDGIAAYKKAIEVGQSNSDGQTAREAEERIREHFHFIASSAVGKQGATRGDADRALAALNELEEHLEPDADTFYYRAVAQNIKGDYDQAITLADQALAAHKGSKTDQAKIYFVKGEALMNKGDSAGAKVAFQNAAIGPYKASAEHYIQSL